MQGDATGGVHDHDGGDVLHAGGLVEDGVQQEAASEIVDAGFGEGLDGALQREVEQEEIALDVAAEGEHEVFGIGDRRTPRLRCGL